MRAQRTASWKASAGYGIGSSVKGMWTKYGASLVAGTSGAINCSSA